MVRIEAKVLVGDHNHDFLQIAFRKLSQRGFTIFTALSGEEAIEILRKEKIESVVLDFNKANTCGLKVINYISTLCVRPTLIPLFFGDDANYQKAKAMKFHLHGPNIKNTLEGEIVIY